MKFRLRFKKRNSVLISVFACAAFVWLSITRLGLPKEKALAWLITLVVLLLILIVFAAAAALVIRWLLRDKENGHRENGHSKGNQDE